MTANDATARYQRLLSMRRMDTENLLLLAEVADASIAAGALDDAQRHIDEGMRREGTSAWRYKLANLRLAQHRPEEAQGILQELRQTMGVTAAIDHNLAYIDFVQGNHAASAQRLEPWLSGRENDPTVAAAQALWLRSMHRMDRIEDAWAWIDKNRAHLGAVASGPASLVALDHGDLRAAGDLAERALNADPMQVEALVARANVALVTGDTDQARRVLEHATQHHPHQARAWSTLGYAELADTQADRARQCFAKALECSPGELWSLLGEGWACVLQGDVKAATRAFQAALQADPASAEALGGLAVTEALGGSPQRAHDYVQRTRQLDADSVAATAAAALASGQADAAQLAKAAAQSALAKRAGRRTNNS